MAKNENPAEDKNTEKDTEKKTKGIVVKFLKSFTPYVKGDVAGISKDLFEKLSKQEIVEKYKK